jgi:hypothetical protein
MPSVSKPIAQGVGLEGVTAGGDININGVQVTNVTQMAQRPPLWVNVPGLPRRMMGRDALIDSLVMRLNGGSMAIHGLPGVGKSALAVVLAHHPQLLTHFSEGVLWAGLGPSPDVMSVLATWGEALGVDVTDQPKPEGRSRAVANAIGQSRLLLVIDDAWQIEAAQWLRCGGPHCAHLLTTRDLGLARSFLDRAAVIRVPELEADPAWDLLQGLAPEACAADPAAARQLAIAVGGLPLALELIGGFLGAPERSLFPELGTVALGELADPGRRLALASVRLGSVDGRAVTLEQAIALSLEGLAAPAVAAFHALGAFAPKPADFDLDAAKAVTQAEVSTLATLVARGLVDQPGGERLALHQIVADVARTNLNAETAVRHREHYLSVVEANHEDWQRIEAVYPQLQWAWEHHLAQATPAAPVLAFVDALRLYQQRRGLWQDSLEWTQRALAVARAAGKTKNTAALLNYLGKVYDDLGDKSRAIESSLSFFS